ncbi:MAG: hypothetical protein LBU20_02545 [Candidatus Nomurabacteria bacterium]|jgi:FMN phosphatase YigB (HAD superfamily)|nr:hypothetical protein [Candidatus Nomurabacteria bacterium]
MRDYKFVFWDWYGVICHTGMWSCNNEDINNYKTYIKELFQNRTLLLRWMRGTESTHALLSNKYGKMTASKLLELAFEGWDEILDFALVDKIQKRSKHVKHVIITDNFDIFDDFITSCKIKNRFYSVFNSATYGKLKLDKPSLFEIAMQSLGLKSFSNCLLLDDSLENCSKFEELGGCSKTIGKVQF